ncbi:MAG: serine/threonine-protein kinase [Gemmatimonadaceae bacterium]
MSATASSAALEDVRRQLSDRYTVDRELGRGGMGAVYLARDLRLDRTVALKVLPSEYATDTSLRERFLRETRTAASFSHPNIVPVHSIEERDNLLAFAMGHVEGESLAERVTRAGPLSVREIVRVLQDIGYALAYAHGRNVVHRDIKPDNIMIERATGRALLMDFGISRVITTTVEARGLTRVGEVVGTPEFMSPEQATGDLVDGRSDLYSLGLVAIFAASGQVVMTGESTQKILVKQLTEDVPPVASFRSDLPEALVAAIDRCVAKQPDDRFASAAALVESIDEAKLATPEIPIPIRLFAAELGTLSMVILFVSGFAWILVRTLSRQVSEVDALLPVAILFAVLLTRVLQAFSEAQRLSMLGFSPAETMAGMRAVVDERESVRAQWRTDAVTRRRRRRTLQMASLQLVVGVLLIFLAMQARVEVSPGEHRSSPGAVLTVFFGFMLLGMSFVLFVRSPFRMPPGERMFRRVWLGPLGRGFVRLAAGRVAKGAPPKAFSRAATSPSGDSPSSRLRRTPAPASATAAEVPPTEPGAISESQPPASDALARLEQRVDALERWRAARK